MALTQVIDGSSNAASAPNLVSGRLAHVNPSTGELYFLSYRSGVARLFRSSNGGSSWTSVSSSGIASGALFIDSVYDSTNGIIYVGVHTSGSVIQVWKYTLSTDTWAQIGGNGHATNGTRTISIGVRSDGSVIVFYCSSTAFSNMGTSYTQMAAQAVTSAGTWGTETIVGGGTTVNYLPTAECQTGVIGASDRFHMIYDSDAPAHYHRSSAGATGNTIGTLDTAGSLSAALYSIWYHSAIGVVIATGAAGTPHFYRGTSQANPTWTGDTGSLGVNSGGVSQVGLAASLHGVTYDAGGSALYVIFGYPTTYKYVSISDITSASTYGTRWNDSGNQVTNTIDYAGVGVLVYGSTIYYFCNDGTATNTYFGSHSVGAAPQTYTDTATISSATTIGGGETRYTQIYKTLIGTNNPGNILSANISVRAKQGSSDPAGGVLNCYLYQGTTVIESWTINLDTNYATYVHQISALGSITDWTQLYIGLQGQAEAGKGLTASVSWVKLTEILQGYADLTTVSSTTTPSATEIGPKVDANTIASYLHVTEINSEFAPTVEANTITGITTISALEGRQLTDANTITTTTTPSSSELHEIFDADTTAVVTTPSSSEIYTPGGITYTDSATIGGTTTPSSTDIVAYIDAATVGGVTDASGQDIEATIETATITGTTTPNGTDVFETLDANIISSVTSPTGSDLLSALDSSTTTGITIPAGTDEAGYVESSTVTSVTTPSSVEVYTHVSYTTIYRTQLTALSTPTSTSPQTLRVRARKANVGDVGSLVIRLYQNGFNTGGFVLLVLTDSWQTVDFDYSSYITDWADIEVTLQGQSDPGFPLTLQVSWIQLEIPEAAGVGTDYFDSDTISGVSSLSATEVAAYVEEATITGSTSPSSIELHELPDIATVSGVTSVSATDVSAYVDMQTASSVSNPSGTELHEIPDTGTVSGTTTLTSTEIADYVDSAIAAGTTTPSATEVREIPDLATISGATTLTYGEVAGYVDTSTITSTTEPISTELREQQDSSTVAGSTTPTAVEFATYVDASITTSSTDVSSTETHEIPDAGTVNVTTTLTSVELAEYVDSSTVTQSTQLTSSEISAYVDGTTAASVSVVSGTDLAILLDVATVEISTSLSSSDIAGYVDADTINGATVVSYDETYIPYGGVVYTDSDTVTSITYVTSVESREITDASTVGGTTQVTSTDISETIEAATTASTTTVSSTDATAVLDSATIDGTSNLTSVERADYADSNTTSSAITVTSSEVADYADSSITPTTTNISSSELHDIPDANETNTVTYVSALDQAEYVEADTVSSATVYAGSETHEIPDTSTVSGITIPSATEVTAVVDTDLIQSATAISFVELAEYVDAATVSTTTEVFSDEVTAGVKVTSTYRTRLTSLYQPSPLDPEYLSIRVRKANTTESGVARIWLYSASTIVEGPYDIPLTDIFSTDTHTITNTNLITDWTDIEVVIQGVSDVGADLTIQISWINLETPAYSLFEYTDTGTINGVTDVNSVEVASLLDAAIVSGSTDIVSVEIAEYTESATISSASSVTTDELIQYVDANTGETSTVVTSAEIVDYSDANETSSATIPSSIELSTYVDTSIIIGSTEISTTDVAAFIDADTTSGVTSITSFEGQTNVYVDSSTPASATLLSSSEYADYLDDASINTSNSIYTTEYYAPTDYGSVGSTTYISYSDLASYVDASTLTGTTTPIGSEFAGSTYIDTETASAFTSITYTEFATYDDREVFATTTIPAGAEETTYLDYGSARSITYIETEEVYKPLVAEEATVTTITYVTGVEFILTIAPELYVVRAYQRWTSIGTQSRTAPVVVYRRWTPVSSGLRFASKANRKLMAWIR